MSGLPKRHVFSANRVAIEEDLSTLCLGEVESDGTVRQWLQLWRDEDEDGRNSVGFELNEQSNACTGLHIEAVRLDDRRLEFSLLEPGKMRGGAFDKLNSDLITEVVVDFDFDKATLSKVSDLCNRILMNRIPFKYTGNKIGG